VGGGSNLNGEEGDDDGDCGDEPDLPTKGAEEPEVACVDCDKPGVMHQDDFNPKTLLQRLCAGGKCPRFDDGHDVATGNAISVPLRGSGYLIPSTGSL